MTLGSRRKPWPYDVLFGSDGYVLLPDQAGLLSARKTETLEKVVPADYGYQSLPPYLETTFAFRGITGMGEKVQNAPRVGRRYRYALNVDNVGGLLVKGASTNAVTPPSTGEIRGFAEALHNGTLAQFPLAGRYVLRRTGDLAADQVVSKDFGAGVVVQQATRFQAAGAAPVDGLYAATSAGELWQRDGAAVADAGAWTKCTLPATQTAQHVARLKDELWIAGGNLVNKATNDPLLVGSWSGSIICGEASSTITSLAVAGGQLWIFKDDGSIGTINTSGAYDELFPALEASRSSTHGRNAVAWPESLWARRGDALIRIDPGSVATLTPAGPELLLENDSEVRGLPVAFAGHQDWHGYLGVYNPLNGHSYLFKYGTWLNPDTDVSAEFRFSQDWNGALVKWTSKQITALVVSGIGGTNERLYAGFADGSIEWLVLPHGTPNPLADSACRFTTATSTVYWPIHHMMLEANDKRFHGFSVFGPTLDATNYATQEYRVDQATSWTDSGGQFKVSGQRQNLTGPPIGRQLESRTILHNAATTATPVLSGVAIHEAVIPEFKLTRSPIVDARSHVAKRDGTAERRSGEQMRTALRALAASGQVTDITWPEGDVATCSVQDYSEVLAPHPKWRDLAWQIALACVEWITLTVFGTVDRLGDLTVDDLGTWTVDDTGGI